VQVGAKFWKMGVRVSPNNIMVSCLEAANHPTLLLTSIWDVYEVFEHLDMPWMERDLFATQRSKGNKTSLEAEQFPLLP
jgi:hypothetical protein